VTEAPTDAEPDSSPPAGGAAALFGGLVYFKQVEQTFADVV